MSRRRNLGFKEEGEQERETPRARWLPVRHGVYRVKERLKVPRQNTDEVKQVKLSYES